MDSNIDNQLQNVTCVLIDNFDSSDNFFTRLSAEMLECSKPQKPVPSIPNNYCFGRTFVVRGVAVTLGSTTFNHSSGVVVVNADRASGYIVDYRAAHFATIFFRYPYGDQSSFHVIY